MGIQGLLAFLAKSTKETHISDFENEYVAIDAYCWLHKSIYSCAYDLAMKRPNSQYVNYCMRYIEMLLHFNVKPILVFDGRMLPSKSETERKRREERKNKLERGKALMGSGDKQKGMKLIGESVEVTHKMALKLIEECRRKNIDCIVAPYEADAQLAYLSIKNIVKCIITEDSDLLAYGCERVMFKMQTNGMGQLIEKSDIYLSLKMAREEYNEDLFRYMCILSGCDYLPSLESIGPANALKFIKMLKGNNIYDVLPKLPYYLNKMKAVVTPEYFCGFKVADNTFKHQLVYDPFQRAQVPVRPAANDGDIIGTKLPDDIAFNMAVGNIDPMTMEKLSNYHPDETGEGFSLLWKTDSVPNAAPRLPFSCIRQNGNLESNAVQPVINDLKKQRTITKFIVRNSNANKNVSKIPACGFLFEPQVEKKTGSSEKNESNLLKSRYFSGAKEETGREKKQLIERESDKRKDESHEDYLQRLYNEYFPPSEESETKQSEYNGVLKRENTLLPSEPLESFCCRCKDTEQCICLMENGNVSDSQSLGECITQAEEVNKNRENSSTEHFLLDEIYKNQMENLSKDEKRVEEEKQGKVSPSQSLSLNFSKILSKITDTPKKGKDKDNSKTEMVEKENAEVICVEEQESARPPSPVFKFQRSGKILKRNCGVGNVSDTAGTPTSVYFSSFQSERLNSSNPQVPLRTTPSNGKKSSARSFNSVPSKAGKNSFKSSSVNRTLFQFGFKKRRRDEYETEV